MMARAAMVLVLLGSGLAVVTPASAHPVQFRCDEPVGYYALGPSGGPYGLWVASLGTGSGGCAVDYPFACVYDTHDQRDCGDSRHVGVPFCKICIHAELGLP